MKKLALALALLVIASTLCLALTGCGGGGSNKLVGTWELEKSNTYSFKSQTITFKSNGKYIYTNENGFEEECDYEVEGENKVRIKYIPYDFKLEGDTLTLYGMAGTGQAVYKKK